MTIKIHIILEALTKPQIRTLYLMSSQRSDREIAEHLDILRVCFSRRLSRIRKLLAARTDKKVWDRVDLQRLGLFLHDAWINPQLNSEYDTDVRHKMQVQPLSGCVLAASMSKKAKTGIEVDATQAHSSETTGTVPVSRVQV